MTQIAGVGGCLDDPRQQRFRFLGRIVDAFAGTSAHHVDIPDVFHIDHGIPEPVFVLIFRNAFKIVRLVVSVVGFLLLRVKDIARRLRVKEDIVVFSGEIPPAGAAGFVAPDNLVDKGIFAEDFVQDSPDIVAHLRIHVNVDAAVIG